MRTATFPSLRVEPELRKAAEQALKEGETLSGFIEQAITESIERRRMREAFIAKGLQAREEARRTGRYVDAETVIDRLERMAADARSRYKRSE
jgi:predicted transcriptional regulator